MMVEVAMPIGKQEDARRKQVATIIESCPFWTLIAALTLLDLTLLAWSYWGPKPGSPGDYQTVELAISTLFVGELALRCYAHDREQLLCAANLFDSFIILSSFVLSLVDVYTPLLAARGARLIRFSATSTRCGRAARNTQRASVEMTNFFRHARSSGRGLAARVAMRASEDDIAPLFIDVAKSAELRAVLLRRPWQGTSRTVADDEETVPLVSAPILAASASLKRLARAEIDNAAAFEVAARAKSKAKHKTLSVVAKDEEAPPEPAQGGANKRALTSARALVAVFEHALAHAHSKGVPPPRLLATLRDDVHLVFLNRDI